MGIWRASLLTPEVVKTWFKCHELLGVDKSTGTVDTVTGASLGIKQGGKDIILGGVSLQTVANGDVFVDGVVGVLEVIHTLTRVTVARVQFTPSFKSSR